MTVGEQAVVFAAMTAGGAALGMLYDALALVRRALCAGSVVTGMLDAGYGLCCGAGVAILALCLRAEAFRLYVFLGTALGWVLYMGIIGIPLRILDAGIRRRVKKSRKVEENYQDDAGKRNIRANNK